MATEGTMRVASTAGLLMATLSLAAHAAGPANGGFEKLAAWKVFERVPLAPESAGLPKEVTVKTSTRVRPYAAFSWPVQVRGKVAKETADAYHILMFDDMPAVLKKSEARVIGQVALPEGWRFHDVVRPASISVVRKGVRSGAVAAALSTKGVGRAFLHSKPFPVQPGRQYDVSAWAKGKGRVGLQLIWKPPL